LSAAPVDPLEMRDAVAAVLPWDSPARPALAKAVRLSLRTLAQVAPGRSVEVRVPPFAAVQCIEGPRHTRGTPGAVVELPAEIWIDLALGRTSWPEARATGKVRASGERTDLSPLLPLLAR
jgi:hypothetical protein